MNRIRSLHFDISLRQIFTVAAMNNSNELRRINPHASTGKRTLSFCSLVALITLIFCSSSFGSNDRFVSQSDTTIVAKHGHLRVQGNQIVDKNGHPVALHGMSLFWSQWMGKYYNYDCIKWLRDDWKCTVVRAAMGIDMGGYLQFPSIEKNKIIAVIDACINLGIYVIVDWHDYAADTHKAEAIAFFREIAIMYGNTPNIIYEIYNEPQSGSWATVIKPYADSVIQNIRSIDPDNLIIVGTPNGSTDVDVASRDPLKQSNVAYVFHFYAASHQQYYRNKAAAALANGVAIFVSEWGTCEYTGSGVIDFAETEKWLSFMHEHMVSWCNWSIEDASETAAALKFGASDAGGWSDSFLATSGLYVRARTRAVYYPIAAIPSHVNYGTLVHSASDDTVHCVLKNIFYDPATIKSIALRHSGPFELLNLPLLPDTIHPSDSLLLNIVFHRMGDGAFHDTIEIQISDSSFLDVQIPVSGKRISVVGPALAGVLYATSSALPTGNVYSLNTHTNAIETIGALGVPEIAGMAIRNSDKAIYGSIATSTMTSLYRISGASGDAVLGRTIPVGNISCIVFSSRDTMYAGTTTGSLYRIDASKGDAAFVGTSPGLNYTGLSFSPISGKLWATTREPYDSIYTIDTRNGVASGAGATGLFAINSSLAFNSAGNLYALIDNGSGEDYLATIDTLTGIPTLVTESPIAVHNLRAIAMISVLTSVETEQKKQLPTSFALLQNYPNPFNPTTTVGYQIPNQSYVTLKIFDVLGREVVVLVNEKKDAGRYSVQWNASAMPSGIYFYRIQTGQFTETKRMILMK